MDAPDTLTLVTRWRVRGTVGEIADILGDVERFPDWWPEVYLGVTVLDPGGPDGVGRTAAVHTRGWLPYTLRWVGRVVESRRPHGWTIEARGDLVGRGVWTLEQQGAEALITYDWRVATEKPVLKLLAPLLRRAFAANHHWAMRRGREGLERELVRRRAGQ
jgi:Polyketide cyclase / dehydrase and lipid transport